MKKFEAKNENVYTQEEMKRYLGALNEMHGENLKGIKEGYDILNRKLDGHSKILDSHTEMIGTLLEDVSVLKSDMSSVKKDISVLKDDMQIVKRELKKKVDYDEFLKLVQRVNKLEKA